MVDSLPRWLEPALADRLRRSPVVVVTGARQTGKTTLVRGFRGAKRRAYKSLDALTTLDQARHDPEALVGSGELLTLDEVQRAPELLLAIKQAVDSDRRPGRFLLTGSANLTLRKGVGDSLAGRAVYLQMHPMTPAERRGAGAAPVWRAMVGARSPSEALAAVRRSSELDWRSLVLEGGFPPAALATDRDTRRLWLDGYVETYVQRDLRDLTQVGDLSAFVRLMRLAALRVGGLLNYADLARDAALSRTTAERWLSILEATFLVTLVPPFASSRSKRLIKTPKLFFGDTGLGLHLCDIQQPADLDDDPHRGRWLENLILIDLLAWRQTEIVKPGVFHFRSAGGQEIDFVVEHGKRLLPIEIKASRSVRVADARILDEFCAEHGTVRAPVGLLLYGGNEAVRLTRTTVAVPITGVI